MRRLIGILFCCCISFHLFAQTESDSITVLKFDDFYALVLNNHPVVKQAELLTDQAMQEVRLARGGFDPKLEGSWDYKDLSEIEYYNRLKVGLKIPVWFPIDPQVGVERATGDFVSDENEISDKTNNQQVFAGVSIPVGKGLFIDQRRATVKQARLFQDMAEAEQIKEMNKILLTAAKDYWEWYFAYNNYLLMQQSIGVAQDIFDRTKLAFDYGETAAIDTIQAKITLQTRMIDYQQANIDRIKAALTLSNNLWNADGAPLELADNVRPEQLPTLTFEDAFLNELVEMARENHPEIRKLDIKNRSLMVDRDLARENLKPQLDLNYVLLDQPFNAQGDRNDITLTENLKVGVDFSFPIFLRKERAKLNQTKLKLIENNFQRDFAERQIINNINGQFNSLVNTGDMLIQQEEMANNYQLILAAERLNLQNGESDLFKINVQIEKLIAAQSKLFKLRATYYKNIANLYWAAGVVNLGLLVEQ
ncbi:TolC family protein [Fulvivirga sp. M361]|uniref:TolC family protein n=1 Tax=Fulvivirga sp. M361 TaxID=2594266 RepID=UPI00117B44BC|nr:TolC family protein [Fulvivirga sp. M361]TRX58229.1 TolC family protein [Fulvivirga sp. M361]